MVGSRILSRICELHVTICSVQGRNLMRPYLPRDGISGSPYSEGGALYALGLMYSSYDQANKAFLLQSLRDSSSEVRNNTLCRARQSAARPESAPAHTLPCTLPDFCVLGLTLTSPAAAAHAGVHGPMAGPAPLLAASAQGSGQRGFDKALAFCC